MKNRDKIIWLSIFIFISSCSLTVIANASSYFSYRVNLQITNELARNPENETTTDRLTNSSEVTESSDPDTQVEDSSAKTLESTEPRIMTSTSEEIEDSSLEAVDDITSND